MVYENLIYKKGDGLALITLDRPNQANGMNYALARELANAAQDIDLDSSIKAVILTGNGRFFCAGGDVVGMSKLGDDLAPEVKRMADELHKAISTFARMSAPVIMAVNGTAAGAGFSLAVTGDYVIASESSSFTMAYTNVGLSPDGSSSYYLPRLIGIRKTQELMFTNRVLSACEACEWNLIHCVVPDDELLERAHSVASNFLNGAAGSNSAIKKLLLQTFDNGLETQMEIEGRLIAECARSDNGREGIRAFSEKRKPNFD
ncbi:enoyl-CoA hydratase-related protein [Maricurvus nonylphenolicus]|uniref:enoyl-CoA hydratase/isomerase family protein n=1 Tax=Maricurvus nonylphenolicus TaxID=1008307 RepID=UPI0036F41674